MKRGDRGNAAKSAVRAIVSGARHLVTNPVPEKVQVADHSQRVGRDAFERDLSTVLGTMTNKTGELLKR